MNNCGSWAKYKENEKNGVYNKRPRQPFSVKTTPAQPPPPPPPPPDTGF